MEFLSWNLRRVKNRAFALPTCPGRHCRTRFDENKTAKYRHSTISARIWSKYKNNSTPKTISNPTCIHCQSKEDSDSKKFLKFSIKPWNGPKTIKNVNQDLSWIAGHDEPIQFPILPLPPFPVWSFSKRKFCHFNSTNSFYIPEFWKLFCQLYIIMYIIQSILYMMIYNWGTFSEFPT